MHAVAWFQGDYVWGGRTVPMRQNNFFEYESERVEVIR